MSIEFLKAISKQLITVNRLCDSIMFFRYNVIDLRVLPLQASKYRAIRAGVIIFSKLGYLILFQNLLFVLTKFDIFTTSYSRLPLKKFKPPGFVFYILSY